jgi:hypothetical protein
MYNIQFEEYAILRPVHPLFVFGDGRIILYKQDHDYLQIYDPRTNTLRVKAFLCSYLLGTKGYVVVVVC